MEYNYPKFTPEMKKTHTILIPNMAITQFRLLEYALRYDGYKCEILGNCGSAVAQLGLKYVHNDTCYPALLVIGQFLDALNSGSMIWTTRPCSSPRPAAGVGPPTTSTCCGRPWSRRAIPRSLLPGTSPVWKKTAASR